MKNIVLSILFPLIILIWFYIQIVWMFVNIFHPLLIPFTIFVVMCHIELISLTYDMLKNEKE